MKNILPLMFLCFTTNVFSSHTIVKLALPDNCNAGPVQVVNESLNDAFNLGIFPNPNSGIFSFDVTFKSTIEKATIKVYDMIGKPIYNEVVYCNTNKLVKQLCLTNLLPGAYIFEILNAREEFYTMLIINKKP